ncbi:MAG: hypothetical protein GWN84_03290, partial [Gammaproteobacteria bacterium]|nr:hypothetical protein [Gammaproteobacteria bacterium]NIR82118.1 hypothetical protein [Gammaproteobacteria bacterium]NIU03236.1 hypothetical protein [Gammaproteobacteria bacterium]NIV50725.1 hypothetical protein [Gammaproteobacteria bacterium]NIX84511.1 hypothetical protein [Gammaproteobacteria bacterium]
IAMLAVLFVLMAAGYCRRSEADELSVGFGVALAGSERCFESMTIMQEFGEGRWLGYLATHGNSPSCRAEQEPIRANVGAGVIRTAHADRWTLGFGAGLLEHGDVVIGPDSILGDDAPRTADRPQLAAAILVRLRIRERLVLDLLHNSTGGSTGFNRGLNTITLGWRVP